MSLFADYIKEHSGKEIIEDSCGFATFYVVRDGIYIEDIYVVPSFRKAKHASYYADEITKIAKERGFNKLFGSVRPSANYSTDSLKILLAYGFKLDSSAIDAIAFVKEI